MKHTKRILVAICTSCLVLAQQVWADDIKPYLLLNAEFADAATARETVTTQLSAGGFELAGQYSPYDGAWVYGITSDELKTLAGQSENGGFGAAIRLSITSTPDGIQVAYLNPDYLSNMYRMEDLSSIGEALTAALGPGEPFGSKKGFKASKLRKYHYMMAMPYFDDVDTLASYDSYDDAIAAVSENLAAGKAGTSLVYRIDLPGKSETLFAVAIAEGDGSDSVVMGVTDGGPVKHTAHLPYELLVTDNKVIALRGRFRIAQSFPDLTMGTFMKISSAPGAIKNTLKAAATR